MKKIFIILLFSPLCLLAQQKRSELEAKRSVKLKEIENIKKISERTRVEKISSVSNLKTLNEQIRQVNEIEADFDDEIAILDAEIKETKIILNALDSDLKEYKEEYKAMIYMAAKGTSGLKKLSYLFSSKTFNQLMARLSYFEKYQQTRKLQIEQISKVLSTLDLKKITLENQVKEKNELTQKKARLQVYLTQLIKEQKETIKELKKKESFLKRQLVRQKYAVKEYEKMISGLVKKSSAKSKTTVSKNTKKANTTSSNKVASSKNKARSINKANKTVAKNTVKPVVLNSFEAERGKLILPVIEGFVCNKFGKQEHPVIEGVWINNIGVDIRTLPNQPALSVFEGQVTAVTKVTNLNYAVVVQHKNYFTVYAKLKSVLVKVGQKIKKKQKVGIVSKNEEGFAELQFQIWNTNNKNFNPEDWFAKK